MARSRCSRIDRGHRVRRREQSIRASFPADDSPPGNPGSNRERESCWLLLLASIGRVVCVRLTASQEVFGVLCAAPGVVRHGQLPAASQWNWGGPREVPREPQSDS